MMKTMRDVVRVMGGLAAATLVACSNDSVTAPVPSAADLGSCTNLQAPAGSTVAAHLYATGVQIYRWNGASWDFVSPSAVLTSDAQSMNTVAIHYSGPTWQGIAGSKVVGTVVGTCTPNANAIPWLLLSGVAAQDAGVFNGTKFIHRVNTTGGLTPTTPGTAGQVISVPYTAEYVFYRAP